MIVKKKWCIPFICCMLILTGTLGLVGCSSKKSINEDSVITTEDRNAGNEEDVNNGIEVKSEDIKVPTDQEKKYSKEDLKVYVAPILSADGMEVGEQKLLFTGDDIEAFFWDEQLIQLKEEYLETRKDAVMEMEKSGTDGGSKVLGVPTDHFFYVYFKDEMLYSGEVNTSRSSKEYFHPGLTLEDASWIELEDCKDKTISIKREYGSLDEVKNNSLHEFVMEQELSKNYADEVKYTTIDKTGTYDMRLGYSIDLNGDGNPERLYYGKNVLKVNDKDFYSEYELDSESGLYEDIFLITDITESDPYLEIGIYSDGDSADPITLFYQYRDNKLYFMGAVYGYTLMDNYQDAIKGDGIIHSYQEAYFIHCFPVSRDWHVTDFGTLEIVEKDTYKIIESSSAKESDIELIYDLPVYDSMDLNSKKINVKKSQHVIFTETDLDHWMKVEAEDGTTGWMYVEETDFIPDLNLHGNEVFLNLRYYG